MNIGEIASLNYIYNTLSRKKRKAEYENEWKFPMNMKRKKKKIEWIQFPFISIFISCFSSMLCEVLKTISYLFHLLPVLLFCISWILVIKVISFYGEFRATVVMLYHESFSFYDNYKKVHECKMYTLMRDTKMIIKTITLVTCRINLEVCNVNLIEKHLTSL